MTNQAQPVGDMGELVERGRAYVTKVCERASVLAPRVQESVNIIDDAMDTIESLQSNVERLTSWQQGGTIFDALCRVRCRNAADFSDDMTAKERSVYDKAVLACFAEIEASLSNTTQRGDG
jgi:hypothetical protein